MNRNKLFNQLVQFLLTFLCITFLSFLLIHLSPSDAAEIQLNRGGSSYTTEQLDSMREEMGLNRPLLIQYGSWLVSLLHGDLGCSMHNRLPVIDELIKTGPNTLFLAGVTMAISIAVSLLLGVSSAMYQGSLYDRIVMMLSNVLAAMPGYFISLVLMYIFALKLGLFNVIGNSADWSSVILPASALSIGMIAPYTRQIRAVVIQESQKLYVLGVRSRGALRSRIYGIHILRNCATTLLSLAGVSLGVLIGGSIIVETIFNWPGLGRLAMDAITHRDHPMLLGYIVLVSTAYFIINSCVDALAPYLDPRQKGADDYAD